MIKALIVDANLSYIDILKKLISEYCPEIEIVGLTNLFKKTEKLILECEPDLIFFDAAIPKNIFKEFTKVISEKKYDFVIVADDSQYAAEALKNGAMDYLVRPVKKADIVRVSDKIFKRKMYEKIIEEYAFIISQTKLTTNLNAQLAVPTVDGYLFFQIDDIIRLEAQGTYTKIFTKNNKVVSSRNIKEYESQLPKEMFFRVHNSHIINIGSLLKYEKGRGGVLTMLDGSKIEVSSRRKAEFLKIFK